MVSLFYGARVHSIEDEENSWMEDEWLTEIILAERFECSFENLEVMYSGGFDYYDIFIAARSTVVTHDNTFNVIDLPPQPTQSELDDLAKALSLLGVETHVGWYLTEYD